MSRTGQAGAAALAGALLALGFAVAPGASAAPPLVITTTAGGLGRGPATNVGQSPVAAAVRPDNGTVYVVDAVLDAVRAIDASGNETVVAGTGQTGSAGDDGPATAAQLVLSGAPTRPSGVATDAAGNVYIADTGNCAIRRVNSEGKISTIAGKPGSCGSGGDGGPGTDAKLNAPTGLAVDSAGNVFVADTGNNAVRKVTNAFGSAQISNVVSAGLTGPTGLAFDADGKLYITDTGTCVVKRLMADGSLEAIAGSTLSCGYNDGGLTHSPTQAQLNKPTGLAFSSGILYIADRENCLVRAVAKPGAVDATISDVAGKVSTAGTTPPDGCGYGGGDGPATSAKLSAPSGLAAAGNDILIADTGNARLRKLSGGTISTVAGNGTPRYSGDGGNALDAQLNVPQALLVQGDLVYVVDQAANVVRAIDAGGTITTIAGTGVAGSSGDGAAATQAKLNLPTALARDTAGNLYISDTQNNVVRKIDPTGTITTVVGTGTVGYSGDGGAPKDAKLNAPIGLAFDSHGFLYIADWGNHVVRQVDFGANVIRTFAGTHTAGYSGDGKPALQAQLNLPRGLAVDAADNLFIADTANNVVRKIDKAGTITTVAGTGTPGYSGDDGPATSAKLNLPFSLLATGNDLLIADTFNNAVRKLASDGTISTIAGSGTAGYAGDGGPATAANLTQPRGIAVDGSGRLLIADSLNHAVRRLIAPSPPGPPKDLTAKAGKCSAEVSWTKPDDDGGSPITGYTITASPGGVTLDAEADATSATVTGLTNGTSYTFTVTATNGAGAGPKSAASNAVKPSDSGTGPDDACKKAVSRLAGQDRIATAIAISRSSFPEDGKAEAVVLATAGNFPDALGGAALAVAKKGPLLLSSSADLDQTVLDEVKRVLPKGKTVFLLGGPVALGSAVEKELTTAGYQVTRYTGADRYETAIAIADKGLGNPNKLLLATGTNFPDALGASAAAAKISGAVVLSSGNKLPAATEKYLAAHSSASVDAIGGPAAAADSKAKPIVGTDRYDTAAEVAKAYFTEPAAVGVATGVNFPDALGGGTHMGQLGGPILLAEPASLSASAKDFITGAKDTIGSAFAYGGAVALSDEVLKAVQDALA